MKNHEVLLKMNWFRTSLPLVSSSQGFYRALSRGAPFSSLMSPEPSPGRILLKREKNSVLLDCSFYPAPSQAFFSYSFPVIQLVTASCPLLCWPRVGVGGWRFYCSLVIMQINSCVFGSSRPPLNWDGWGHTFHKRLETALPWLPYYEKVTVTVEE